MQGWRGRGSQTYLTHQLLMTVSQSMWQFAWLRPKVLMAAGETHKQISSGIPWKGARSSEGGHGDINAVAYQVQRGLGNGWSSPCSCYLTDEETEAQGGKVVLAQSA